MEGGLPKSSDKAWNSKGPANPRHKRQGSTALQGGSNPLLHSPTLQARIKGRGALLQLGGAKGGQSGAHTHFPQTGQHTDRYTLPNSPEPWPPGAVRSQNRDSAGHSLPSAGFTHTHTLAYTPCAAPLPSSGLGDLGPGAPTWRLVLLQQLSEAPPAPVRQLGTPLRTPRPSRTAPPARPRSTHTARRVSRRGLRCRAQGSGSPLPAPRRRRTKAAEARRSELCPARSPQRLLRTQWAELRAGGGVRIPCALGLPGPRTGHHSPAGKYRER